MLIFQEVPESAIDASERAWIMAAKHEDAKLTNGTRGGRGNPDALEAYFQEHPEHHSVIAQSFRTNPDRLAYRNQRIKEGHAKIDRTPTMCEECGGGPFAGEQGVVRHASHKHRDHEDTWCDVCGGGPEPD